MVEIINRRVAGILLVLMISTAQAAEIPIFSPPYDFVLLDPQSPPPPGGPFPYASTGGTPTWGISSWDIPGGKLPPFLTGPAGMNILFTSSAAESSVKIAHTPSGLAVYQLFQNGAALPCEEGGAPRESDLFASPNGYGTKPPAGSGLLLAPDQAPALTGLAQLVSSATVMLQYANAVPSKVCPVSQGAPLVSVILNNLTAHQTLFYQLALSNVCGPQPRARARLCEAWGTHARSSYFFQRNPFGVDDALPAFNQPWLANNETRTISIDLLPHLIKFVANGPPKMDHNPAHWSVGSYYNGQHIWGGLTMTTTWEDVSLVAITK